MDTAALIVLIFESLLFLALLTAIQYPLRKGEHRVIRTAVFILKLFMVPVAALLWMTFPTPIPYVHSTLMCALYIAMIADVLASIIEYVVRRVRTLDGDDSGERHIFDYRIGAPMALLLCVAVLASGVANAENIVVDEHEWQADGLEQSHTFAFASDLHSGDSLTMGELRNFCRQVNESKAEFLILGGDTTDELTSYEDMVETFNILSTVKVPVYYVYGNHDRQPSADYVGGRTYTDEQLRDAIESAGITILSDEFVKVADDLVLLGREDLSIDTRKDWKDLENPYEGVTLIVADHQPYDKEQLAVEESALQVSGHTHAGQAWPLKFIYGALGYDALGEYERPHTLLYVSPGVGGWSPSFRSQGHSAWELITLNP